MADKQAITDMCGEYAWALDANDFDLLAKVFHEDASFTINIPGADPVGPFQPRTGIIEFISGTVQGQNDQRRHLITNLRYASESETGADVTAILTLIVIENGELRVQATGVYNLEVVLADGAWQIRTFSLDLDLPF